MSNNKQKRYMAEFKNEAIKRANVVGPYKVCKELGISSSSLYKWLAEAGYQGTSQPTKSHIDKQNPFNLAEENKLLKKENARLKEEREILKKATAIEARQEK